MIMTKKNLKNYPGIYKKDFLKMLNYIKFNTKILSKAIKQVYCYFFMIYMFLKNIVPFEHT